MCTAACYSTAFSKAPPYPPVLPQEKEYNESGLAGKKKLDGGQPCVYVCVF